MTKSARRLDRKGATTHFTHTHLWLAGQWALARATDDATVTFDAGLLALIASALATEAYLNYIGPKVCASWSRKKERLSPKDKLALICAQLDMPLDPNAPDHEAFVRLFALRNELAHAKPEIVAGAWRERDFPADPRQDAPWMHYARANETYQLIGLVRDLLGGVSRAAGEEFGPFAQLGTSSARRI